MNIHAKLHPILCAEHICANDRFLSISLSKEDQNSMLVHYQIQ